jgi:phytoene synthase
MDELAKSYDWCEQVARQQAKNFYYSFVLLPVAKRKAMCAIYAFMRYCDELYAYCYRVASVVGLTIIHIFEFSDPKALELAEKCGIAFQLTNILRDVKEDAGKRRIYLPAKDLDRFGVSPETFAPPEAFRKLMAFEAERARRYFNESQPLIPLVTRSSRASLQALISIYSRLLDKIVASHYDVLSQRIRLSTASKLWLLIRSLMSRH